jgi:hypothetical protein
MLLTIVFKVQPDVVPLALNTADEPEITTEKVTPVVKPMSLVFVSRYCVDEPLQILIIFPALAPAEPNNV